MREKFEPKIEYGEGRKEKHSSVKKMIGSTTEEDKGIIREEMERRFNNQDSGWEEMPELEKRELTKTIEEIGIIELINNETNKLLFKFGLEKFDVFPDNVHLFRKKDLQDFLNDESPQFLSQGQAIIIPKSKSRIIFTESCLHEMVHFKSFLALQAEKGEPARRRQVGINIKTKSEKEMFKHLNEAVAEEITKRIFYSLISQKPELLKKEIEETKRVKKEFLLRGHDRNDVDDIYFAQTYPVLIAGEKEYKTEIEGFGYFRERKILNSLIEKIYLKNKDKFKNKEEVFDLFVKSTFTGKLDWGSLVNRTFGKGTFKKLAQLDENIDGLAKFVESL